MMVWDLGGVKLCSMRPSEALSLHRSQIREIALRHRVSDVRVFGSVARRSDTAESDIDLLVDFGPERSLYDLVGLQLDIESMLGRRTDVVTEASLSIHLRERVLAEARPL